MNGHILPVSSMAGSHRTLLIANTPTSATNVPRTFIYDLQKQNFESWTIDWSLLMRIHQRTLEYPLFFGLTC